MNTTGQKKNPNKTGFTKNKKNVKTDMTEAQYYFSNVIYRNNPV